MEERAPAKREAPKKITTIQGGSEMFCGAIVEITSFSTSPYHVFFLSPPTFLVSMLVSVFMVCIFFLVSDSLSL